MGLGIKARYSLALAFGIQNFEKASYPVIREGIAFWWTYHQAQRSFLKKHYEIETRFKIIAEFLKDQLEGCERVKREYKLRKLEFEPEILIVREYYDLRLPKIWYFINRFFFFFVINMGKLHLHLSPKP
ncbi:MAG: hypothetical protein QW040_03540 [Candidatus Aenigmatarchaeota archaeon]